LSWVRICHTSLLAECLLMLLHHHHHRAHVVSRLRHAVWRGVSKEIYSSAHDDIYQPVIHV
jgi:hypothetical protein